MFIKLHLIRLLALPILAGGTLAAPRTLVLKPVSTPRALPERILGAAAEAHWEHLIDDPRKVAALKTMRLAYTRFPGGTQSNYYDWKTGLFLFDAKPNSSVYYKYLANIAPKVAMAHPDGISLEQYKAFSDSIGAEAVLVPNFETATVEDQVAWFKKLAAENVVPSHIELGNEYWIATLFDPEALKRWPDEPTSMRIMRQYLDALRPYLPRRAKAAVQASGAAFDLDANDRTPGARRLRRWNEDLKPESWFDAVTIHLYPRLDQVLGRRGASSEALTPETALRNLRALMTCVDERTDRALEDLARRLPGKEIWITEWNPRGADPVFRPNQAEPVTPAILLQLVTRMTMAFLRHPEVTVAQFFMLHFTQGSPFTMFAPDGKGGFAPYPATMALRWFNEAANGGATFERLTSGTFEVEGALFRNHGRATLVLQNASAEEYTYALKEKPARIERLAMADLADAVKRAADVALVAPAAQVPVPPYSVTRIIWEPATR